MRAQLLTVVRSETIAGQLQRLTLSGDSFNHIAPDDYHGRHIKLFFKRHGQQELLLPSFSEGKAQWPAAELKPIARTYSIAGFDDTEQTLTVDFVLHADHGIASSFALNAQPGDVVGFNGPGPAKLVNRNQSDFIFVGDLSALPAIASVVESLTQFTSLSVFIEMQTTDAADELINVYFPKYAQHVQVCTQKFNPEETLVPKINSVVADISIRSPELSLEQKLSVTIAGEHATVVCLRSLFRQKGLSKPQLYAVPYWRHKMSEETYHQQRHEVMDN